MKNFIKNSFVGIIVFSFIFIVPLISFALEGDPEGGNITIVNPISSTDIVVFIKNVLVSAIKIGIPIIALALVYSGFLFVSARGSSKELETAKKSLLYTIIGAAILLGSWAIALLIQSTVSQL